MNFTKTILLLSLISAPLLSQAQNDSQNETKLSDEQKLEKAWKEYLTPPADMKDEKLIKVWISLRKRHVCDYGCPDIFNKERN